MLEQLSATQREIGWQRVDFIYRSLEHIGRVVDDAEAGSGRKRPIVRLERYDGQISSFARFRRGARRGLMIGLGASAFLTLVALITPTWQSDCASISETAEVVLLSVRHCGYDYARWDNRVTVPRCMDASSGSRMSGYRAV